MATVAIIQARMGSSRLPGKILKLLGNRTVLGHVITRVRASNSFDRIVVATTDRAIDDAAADEAEKLGALVVRGPEDDVLSRYSKAAAASEAKVIMRITADCPLIDPIVLARMVRRFQEGDADLVTNARQRTFPRGLDAEIFSRAALDTMQTEAYSSEEREHVTPYLYRHPERFRIVDFVGEPDLSHWRLTLDTEEDLTLLEAIALEVEDLATLLLPDIQRILTDNPDWLAINGHIEQKKLLETKDDDV